MIYILVWLTSSGQELKALAWRCLCHWVPNSRGRQRPLGCHSLSSYSALKGDPPSPLHVHHVCICCFFSYGNLPSLTHTGPGFHPQNHLKKHLNSPNFLEQCHLQEVFLTPSASGLCPLIGSSVLYAALGVLRHSSTNQALLCLE